MHQINPTTTLTKGFYADPRLRPERQEIDLIVDTHRVYDSKTNKKNKGRQASAKPPEEDGVENEGDLILTDSAAPTFFIIGFDTEYIQDPTDTQRNIVLSYQFNAILPDASDKVSLQWSGICYPESGQRSLEKIS